MDNLTSLLKAAGPAAVNQQVRSKMLELIQTWATATEGRPEYTYIGEVYKTLQREGYEFPPRVSVASSMIDSSAVSDSNLPACYGSLTDMHTASPPNGSTPTCA